MRGDDKRIETSKPKSRKVFKEKTVEVFRDITDKNIPDKTYRCRKDGASSKQLRDKSQ